MMKEGNAVQLQVQTLQQLLQGHSSQYSQAVATGLHIAKEIKSASITFKVSHRKHTSTIRYDFS